jgi:hypothetical protein
MPLLHNLWSAIIGSDQLASASIALFGAVTGTVVSAVIAAYIAGRARYQNTVTAERVKWINALRELMAEFLAVTIDARFKAEDRKLVADELRKHSHQLSLQLGMQLNPSGEIERNILRLLQPYVAALADPRREDHAPYMHAIFAHSQFLFKEEWEKVKAESSGWLWRNTVVRARRAQRLCCYRQFCKSSASMLDSASKDLVREQAAPQREHTKQGAGSPRNMKDN